MNDKEWACTDDISHNIGIDADAEELDDAKMSNKL